MSARPYLTVASTPFSLYREVHPESRSFVVDVRDKLISDAFHASKKEAPRTQLRAYTEPPSAFRDELPNGLSAPMLNHVNVISNEHLTDRGYLSDLKVASSAVMAKLLLLSLNQPQDNEPVPLVPSGPYYSLNSSTNRLYVGLSFEKNKVMEDAFLRAYHTLHKSVNCSVRTMRPHLILGVLVGADAQTQEIATRTTSSTIRYDYLPMQLGPIVASGDIFIGLDNDPTNPQVY